LKRDRRRRRRFGGRRGALLEDWRRAGRGVVVVVVVARPFFFGPLLVLGCWLLMFELRLVEVVVHSAVPCQKGVLLTHALVSDTSFRSKSIEYRYRAYSGSLPSINSCPT